MSDRFTQCKEAVLAYADYLIERIKAGKMNASAFEGLVSSYIEQPGYDATFRDRLLNCALTRMDGRERS
jgi:hypothetical protein